MKAICFGLLFCCAALASGAEIPLDGSFPALSPKDNAPIGWTKEFAHQGGFGECKLLPGSDGKGNALQVLTASKLTNFYYNDMFKVAPGDTVTLEADVRGEGSFCMTLYIYDNGYITALPRKLAEVNSAEFKTVKYEFTIESAYLNRTPKIARVVFCIGPESLVAVEKVKGSVNGK